MSIQVGLYGTNGHQVEGIIKNVKNAALRGVAGFTDEELKRAGVSGTTVYASLDAMLKDDNIQLVSLCSPRRSDQASDAVKALNAGKHVYAEKPCALNEKDLDLIIETAYKHGLMFHEMAGTAFDQPYLAMRELVQSGIMGDIVQVFAQKSYPYHDGRPQDEDVDGGLIRQAGIHAARFIEHVAGVKVTEVSAVETGFGNPKAGGLIIASALSMRLENGGIASIIANYLNQPGFGSWGNECLRIFGTKAFLEAADGGRRTRLVVGKQDMGEIQTKNKGLNYFELFINAIAEGAEMPLSLEDELHPTRVVIRAKGI